MNQIIKEICFEEWNNAENFNIYFNDFKEKAEETWKLMKTEIGKTINEFFNIT